METIMVSTADISERTDRLNRELSRTLATFAQDTEKNAMPPVFIVGLLVRLAMKTAKYLPEMKDESDALSLVKEIADAYSSGNQQFVNYLIGKLADGMEEELKK